MHALIVRLCSGVFGVIRRIRRGVAVNVEPRDWVLLAVIALLSVQSCRLDTERADHRTTAAKLKHEQGVSEILRDSTDNAHTSIAALQKQLESQEAARKLERKQAAGREAVLRGAKTVPVQEAGVVDMETSRKAVGHFNETLSRRARF